MTICRNCKNLARFNFRGLNAKFCGTHKTVGMTNIYAKICQYPECKTRPSFGVPGTNGILRYTNVKFCRRHKASDMISIAHKRCDHLNCESKPIYNLPEMKVGKYCCEHKTADMILIAIKRCQYSECSVLNSLYNVPGMNVGKFCKKHKTADMINVVFKRCEYPECVSTQRYYVPGVKNGKKYCRKHKTADMIDVAHNSTFCKFLDCKSCAIYNVRGMKKKYCKLHKAPEMIDVVSKRCQYIGCETYPSYNVPQMKAGKFCMIHKTTEMINVLHKTCIGQEGNCTSQVTSNYRGYCLHCFMHTFPNEPVIRNYKTKEKLVVDRIQDHFPGFVWRHDKKVECGVSNRRPDLLLDVGSHVLIIEIDEDSHESYDCTCENKRLMQLSLDVSRINYPEINHRDIVLIRFNPDKYTDTQGQKHMSCFYRNKSCGVVLAKSHEWEERITELIKTVEFWIINQPERTILLLNLFMTQLS